jgi:hypothetical protein
MGHTPLFLYQQNYCAGAIAETGQIDAHVPQDTHFAGSITHFPSESTEIAIIGQTAIHE